MNIGKFPTVTKGSAMYYTPKEIIDPASGSGEYLKRAADELLKNPPYELQWVCLKCGVSNNVRPYKFCYACGAPRKQAGGER